MDGHKPQVHKVWIFCEVGVSPDVRPTVRVDVGAGFVGKFATNYLTEDGHKILMFRVNTIYGII